MVCQQRGITPGNNRQNNISYRYGFMRYMRHAICALTPHKRAYIFRISRCLFPPPLSAPLADGPIEQCYRRVTSARWTTKADKHHPCAGFVASVIACQYRTYLQRARFSAPAASADMVGTRWRYQRLIRQLQRQRAVNIFPQDEYGSSGNGGRGSSLAQPKSGQAVS